MEGKMTKEEFKKCLKERAKIYRIKKVSRSNFTDEQLDEFRELLETQRYVVSREKKHFSSGFKSELRSELEPNRSGNHIADTNQESSPIMENIVGNRDKRLQKIDKALQRLDDGTYGICQVCEEPINIHRLLSWPATRFCTSCKENQNAAEAHANGTNGNHARPQPHPYFASA